MDALALSAPRRLTIPIDNRWGGGEMAVLDFGDPARPVDLIFVHGHSLMLIGYDLLCPSKITVSHSEPINKSLNFLCCFHQQLSGCSNLLLEPLYFIL
jgi:hypothetical protein